MATEVMTAEVSNMTAEVNQYHFNHFVNLYNEQIQQEHQEIKEMCDKHAKQDLINLYVEYIAELDEHFNYPNRRGEGFSTPGPEDLEYW